jgi:hypothetical protein
MMTSAPYSNSWMIILAHLTSAHHCILIGLQCIFVARELDEDLAPSIGLGMLITSVVFVIILFLVCALAFATPVLLKRVNKRRENEAIQMFFGRAIKDRDERPILLDPVEGLRMFTVGADGDSLNVSGTNVLED